MTTQYWYHFKVCCAKTFSFTVHSSFPTHCLKSSGTVHNLSSNTHHRKMFNWMACHMATATQVNNTIKLLICKEKRWTFTDKKSICTIISMLWAKLCLALWSGLFGHGTFRYANTMLLPLLVNCRGNKGVSSVAHLTFFSSNCRSIEVSEGTLFPS